MGLVTLQKKPEEGSLSSPLQEDTVSRENQLSLTSVNQDGGSHKILSLSHCSWIFQLLELREVDFGCMCMTGSIVLCYRSWERIRHQVVSSMVKKQEEKKAWTTFFQAMKENFYEFKPQGKTFLIHLPLPPRK